MHRTFKLTILCAAYFCAAPLLAAPAPPTTDPARFAAAQRLLDAMHYDSLIDRTINAYVADAQKRFPAEIEDRVGPLPAELKDKLFAVIAASIRHAMNDNRAELRRGTALIYASRFTAAEIDHLTQLQSDPVMVKRQAELPAIMTESAELGHAAVQREMPILARQIEQVVKEYRSEGSGHPAT